jgi:hypothetical protein
MEDIMYIIDWILRITGLLSLILGTLAFALSRKEYISNIKVEFLGYDQAEPDEDDLRYYEVYKDNIYNNEYTLFRPIGCEVKYLKIYELEWNSKKKVLEKKQCLKTYKDIGHYKGIVLNIYYVEGIPTRKIEWKTDYGMKGEHFFSYNGFNGKVDITFYKYKFGLINNLRRIFGLK